MPLASAGEKIYRLHIEHFTSFCAHETPAVAFIKFTCERVHTFFMDRKRP